MDGGHAVRAVRADDGEVGHTNLPLATLFDEADALHPGAVAGEAHPDVVEETAVDLEDDLEVAREEDGEPVERPLLERLGQQRVVGVGERAARQVPGLLPRQVRVVEQDAHQLRHRHGGMGVVQLDRDVVGQRAPVGVPAAEPTDEVGQRASDQEVLLHEPEPLPHRRRIVGIEHAGQRLGREAFGERADEVAVAELLEVEVVARRRRPQPERVDRLPAVADDGTIERNADQRRRSPGDRLEGAGTDLERAVERHLHAFVEARHLPRVWTAQPVVRLLPLPAVLDRLPEHPVLVAQPVAHGGELHGRHRVEEAGREPAEAAVPEAGVGLLLQEAEPVEPFLRDDLPRDRLEQQVHDIVRERAAEQELHRQVVDALRVLALIGLLGADPPLG